MVSVIILIRTNAGAVWEVSQQIAKIDGITKSDVVTGPYDVIAYAVLPSTEDLRRLMQSIHSVNGVTRTETCVAM
jgi:DNA-binding Lrp family transcriptional regulator